MLALGTWFSLRISTPENMKLYDYLKKQLSRQDPHPAIDNDIRATLHPDGRISFYIHAEGRDSDTADFWISDLGIEAPVPCDTSEVNSIFNEKYHGSAVILDGKCIKGMLITIVEESSSSNV